MHTSSSGQEPTTPYLEPERFIHRTKKKKKKRNPFIPLENRVPKVKYLPFENLFEAEVVYNLFLDLPFPMPDDQPMWGNNRAVAPTPEAAIIVVDLEENFTVKGHHLSMIKDRQLFLQQGGSNRPHHGSPHAANATQDEMNTNVDTIKLKLFPSSLTGDAKVWFNELSPSVFTTWEEMRQAFMEALTIKIDSQFKDIKGEMKEMREGFNSCGGPHLSSECDDKPMGGPKEEKANYAYGGYRGNYYEVKINVPLVNVLAGMPNYGKFLQDLVSNKSKMEQIYVAFLNEECSAIVQNKLPPKLGDPGSFLIPCTLANSVECLALADLGASINLMPYSMYASLSENTLKSTMMSIRLANHTYQYPMGVAKNMLVQVGKFMFPVDFVILQMEEDDKVSLILGRPFLHTADAIT
ncbi:reverse transcriptase domain-containing protein [Tanacetum coccineum]